MAKRNADNLRRQRQRAPRSADPGDVDKRNVDKRNAGAVDGVLNE